MDDTSGVDVFETTLRTRVLASGYCAVNQAPHQYLIEEVLDELLLKRSGCEETVKIRSE